MLFAELALLNQPALIQYVVVEQSKPSPSPSPNLPKPPKENPAPRVTKGSSTR